MEQKVKSSMPHSITELPPLELMLSRKVRDKLLSLKEVPLPDRMNEILRNRDKAAKERSKEYADKRHGYRQND